MLDVVQVLCVCVVCVMWTFCGVRVCVCGVCDVDVLWCVCVCAVSVSCLRVRCQAEGEAREKGIPIYARAELQKFSRKKKLYGKTNLNLGASNEPKKFLQRTTTSKKRNKVQQKETALRQKQIKSKHETQYLRASNETMRVSKILQSTTTN